jgi:DNA-binding SARP family transcriptional activator
MKFNVLGPIEVVGAGGTRVNMVGAAQRRLTAMLVLKAGTMVPAECLSSRLGLTPGALRTSISRLRRVVGPDVVVTEPPGYELRVVEIDARLFEIQIAKARVSVDARTAIDEFAEALTLWTGPAYAEFADESWAFAESRRLAELRANAVEELVDRLLEVGDVGRAIDRLEALIVDEPFRDRPRGQMMMAYAQSGRQTDALRAFQAYRTFLHDQAGTEPSTAIVTLDRQIASNMRRPPNDDGLPSHRATRRHRTTCHPRHSLSRRRGATMVEAELRERRDAVVRAHMQSENELNFDETIATFRHPRYELVATGEVHDGEAEVRRYFAASRAVVPDQRNELISLHHADDAVIAEFWLLGTPAVAVDGRGFRCRMCVVFEFEPGHDRISCERAYWDRQSVDEQLAPG